MQLPVPRSSAFDLRAVRSLAALALLAPALAWADDPTPPGTPTGDTPTLPREEQRARPATGGTRYNVDFQGAALGDVMRYFADLTGENFILDDPRNYRDPVTIISNTPVSREQAMEAFLQALEMKGYTLSRQGGFTQIIKAPTASQSSIPVRGAGEEIPATTQYITQIIPLENVSVTDIQQVVQNFQGPNAKVVPYAPSNTLIVTDSAYNIRRIFQIIQELDIAAPKSRLEIVELKFANAAEVAQIIEQLYPSAASGAAVPQAEPQTNRRRRPRRDEPAAQPTAATGGVVGQEATFIQKVIAEERTNSLIILANDEGHAKIRDLLDELDVDIEGRSHIHVVYLEHAKAEDVAQVLANLSEGGSSSQQQRTSPRRPETTTAPGARASASAQDDDTRTNVTAAFDSGMRITHDENTNSLVIIASQEDFRVVKQVIDMLDVRRRQVFVDAVILELSSNDSMNLGLGFHAPLKTGGESTGIIGSTLGLPGGGNSLGLTQDLLSGVAVGVFGPTVEVPFASATGITNISVPAFGIVLNALKSNSSVNIVSNPNLLTLDNEEAKIVVGRKIPFPTTSGLNNLGQPVVSFQREDVAITLQMTPRVNSSNFVTLELLVEVQEIEEDDRGLNVQQAGFITSKREVESVVLVRDNQTIVLGGLMGTTDTNVETKVPILGDIPLIGALFRGSRDESRKTNLMLFLTPHIIDDEDDMLEVMRVKEAQRQEFLRRFYGRSLDQQMAALQELLQFSMNYVDEPSMYRGPEPVVDGVSDDARRAIGEALEEAGTDLPEGEVLLTPGGR